MTQFIFNGHEVSEEDFEQLIESSQCMYQAQERTTQERYGVSEQTASAIVYLRSRSRWTQEKEQELVDRDKSGDPISLNTVLSGDF